MLSTHLFLLHLLQGGGHIVTLQLFVQPPQLFLTEAQQHRDNLVRVGRHFGGCFVALQGRVGQARSDEELKRLEEKKG